MSNCVITVSPEILNEMITHYKPTFCSQHPPGSVFVAKSPGCTITAYKSGKVLFQGKDTENEVRKWETTIKRNPTNHSPNKSLIRKQKIKFEPPENIGELSIIGSDEVGTGDYFGPMTVVAAYVPIDKIALLKQLGVKDSKALNDNHITAIAKEIIPLIPHSLLILRNEKYNDLEKNGMNQGKMKAELHNQAIQHVIHKLEPSDHVDGILIDQFCEPGVFFNYLKGKEISWMNENVYFSTKAESVHIAVAAASIIARYAFITEFENLSNKAGFVLPKGAGMKVDEAAAKLIRKYGEKSLFEFTKIHFANTEKARNLSKSQN
ncbi:ribonuclease HIII [Calidifontibacillus oryziterrae]|uniref:ribonuclease HIII n=1 Tax=Calidifontibacillus oryziterrae TaxID=1191699 RepID=UPI0002EC8E31|nr:ribonuclease HIII [Calidifontibacillus oryziterrae]